MTDAAGLPEKVTNENLLEAVTSLTSAVRKLNDTLKADYPKRNEVRRTRRAFTWAVVVALILSYFFNVSTINYCFLQGVPEPGTHNLCKVFPGWDDSFDNNRETLQTFIAMQKTIENNQKIIAQNQKEIAKLKAKVK